MAHKNRKRTTTNYPDIVIQETETVGRDTGDRNKIKKVDYDSGNYNDDDDLVTLDFKDLKEEESQEIQVIEESYKEAVRPPPTASISTGSSTDVTIEIIEDPTLTSSKQVDQWKRFAILPQAPNDHMYLSSSVAQPSKGFHAQILKEHKKLEEFLPNDILVRAYEDRSDLLRALLVGPRDTPYEDALVLIDFHLPSNFPQSPPSGYFHHWSSGPKINPNLYAEGTICLSILNTWRGNKNECWQPKVSSILQVLISIQGLVLVKEPFYLEPEFYKSSVTDPSSRSYSEMAYVKSRQFIERILNSPPSSFEDEVYWFYYRSDYGRLRRAIERAESILSERKGKGKSNEISNMVSYAILEGPIQYDENVSALERSLNNLKNLYKKNRNKLNLPN